MSSESESEESLCEYDVEKEAVSAEEIQVENDVEEEAMSETEENQADNSDAEEQETERNDEHEVEQETQVEGSQDTTNKKKKNRSWVWDYFTYDNTTKKAKCIHCKILISCNKGCTSGMSGHMNSKHKLIKEKGKNNLQ